MGRTPDRFPGIRTKEEGIDLVSKPLAAAVGEMRYNGGANRFSFFDTIGEYDPRAGGLLDRTINYNLTVPADKTQLAHDFTLVDGFTITIEDTGELLCV